MAMEGFACTEGRQVVTDCSPAVFYTPLFFFTRFPLPATKMWNFVELFEPLVWGLVFLSIFYFFIFIKICNVAVRKIENLGTITEWFLLFPFGYVLSVSKFKIFPDRLQNAIERYILFLRFQMAKDFSKICIQWSKQDQKSTRCDISKPDIAKRDTAKPETAMPVL